MTDHQKQQIRESPIYWRADDCTEICTQIEEQLVTDAVVQARSTEVLTGESTGVLGAHEEAMASIMALGKGADGYLVWAYMALPSIEQAVDAGAWDATEVVGFFTAEYA